MKFRSRLFQPFLNIGTDYTTGHEREPSVPGARLIFIAIGGGVWNRSELAASGIIVYFLKCCTTCLFHQAVGTAENGSTKKQYRGQEKTLESCLINNEYNYWDYGR